ncbi:helix-turn-helix domain-containing protein [Paraburkholderia phymatum]|uniref:Transcriptional regulator, XRE family n=1 Tax=Paraburkholderia phymatum (strain DSM 17167 / CIP 108236 / LMG 21445 / STM815) TaxID=391038 RepID=B2JP53_PARP8|nr:helix-turn-helix domain-containing protein [Paraburkholderia phymatum]ACC74606.1 transcriptional regulator, XRE family [Paraburkholderia phymatum STM815]
MDYSVKTLGQLRPVLRGFRKAAGLTQAMLAERLGITQQSYAQFEANPAAAGVERLFKVLRLLNAGIKLSQDEPASENAAPAAKIAPSPRPAVQGPRATAKVAPRKPATGARSTRQTPAIKTGELPKTGTGATGVRQSAAGPGRRAGTTSKRPASAARKREQW